MRKIFCFLCFVAVYAAKTYVFDAINAKKELNKVRIPELHQHRHEKQFTNTNQQLNFSVTPLFAGVAWREAVDTAVCVNAKVYCVQSTGQRIRTLTFTGVTTIDDPTHPRERRVLKLYSYISELVNTPHVTVQVDSRFAAYPTARLVRYRVVHVLHKILNIVENAANNPSVQA